MSAVKKAPATPLPWTAHSWRDGLRLRDAALDDEEYRVHAANAYPRLVEALDELLGFCRRRMPTGNVPPQGQKAIDLLRDLGEAE